MTGSEPRQIPLQLRLDDEATLDNFHVAAANRDLVDYLCGLVSADTGEAYSASQDFCWLYGEEGTGRSHLLQALCHEIQGRGGVPFYLPLAEFRDWDPAVLEGLEGLDGVCLDDIDAIAGQAAWETALFHLYNRLAQSGTPLYAAARAAPRRTPVALRDLASRLQTAAVFRVHGLDDAEKMAALQLRARSRGMTLGDDVARYLITRGERGMKSLLETLSRLDDYSLRHKRRITVPLARAALQ